MKKIEDNNTLVFIVDTRANKRQITDAVRRMYEIKTAKVNTLIRCAARPDAHCRRALPGGAAATHAARAHSGAAQPHEQQWPQQPGPATAAAARLRRGVLLAGVLLHRRPGECSIGRSSRSSSSSSAGAARREQRLRCGRAWRWGEFLPPSKCSPGLCPRVRDPQPRRPEEGVRALDDRLRCARRREQDRHHLNSAPRRWAGQPPLLLRCTFGCQSGAKNEILLVTKMQSFSRLRACQGNQSLHTPGHTHTQKTTRSAGRCGRCSRAPLGPVRAGLRRDRRSSSPQGRAARHA